jgi:MinD-like ATPase involved in chromosome partitioning or flagellar assembly
MPSIISVHSFRGGTGKSNVTANVAALLAAGGRRVGVVDTDIQSPGIHILFGLDTERVTHSLNDYLWGRCAIEQAAHDVTPGLSSEITGQVWLIPSSLRAGDIARVLREGYDVGLLSDGYEKLGRELGLDVLIIDTHPGLNEETLLSIALSDGLAILLRPDQQDYQGTGVTVEVARKLEVPRMLLVINKIPPALDPAVCRAQVEQTYGCAVAAALPYSEEMLNLASGGVFALRFPEHPLTTIYRDLATALVP